ncbi:hypothetical protein, partial [Streptomyces turgidiscabies]|uniref:hypothetical protein n=1 Tax=Streptomyces turgidiscabies TaxID=85558 RepID=UPI0038F7C5DC
AAAERLENQPAPRSLVAGSLKLVGLNEIRDSLGDRWPVLADRARRAAAEIVERSLAATDTFSLNGEDCFVICFAELTEAEAVVKAGAIARE